MSYIVVTSNESGREAKVIQSEEAVVKLIEEKIKEGLSEDSIQVFSGEQVPFKVEKVPVVKLTTAESATESTTEEAAADSNENASSYTSFTKFNEEQVFSLDS